MNSQPPDKTWWLIESSSLPYNPTLPYCSYAEMQGPTMLSMPHPSASNHEPPPGHTWTEVIDPLSVVVMRSCSVPRSVARVGWYPTAEGIRPSSADTSEFACTSAPFHCQFCTKRALQSHSADDSPSNSLSCTHNWDNRKKTPISWRSTTCKGSTFHQPANFNLVPSCDMCGPLDPPKIFPDLQTFSAHLCQTDLCEPEDVVNEEQHILALCVTEVLCNGQTCRKESLSHSV